MSDNFLQLNSKKSDALIIAPNNVTFVIKQSMGPQSAHCAKLCQNDVGVIFDQSLSLDELVSQFKISCFFHLRNITKLRQVVTNAEVEVIVHAFNFSCWDYCNALFNCPNQFSVYCLQTVHNPAMPIEFCIDFKILVLAI